MIEEKSTEIEGNRFPIKRYRSKSPIKWYVKGGIMNDELKRQLR